MPNVHESSSNTSNDFNIDMYGYLCVVDPSDVADGVVFLLSDLSKMVHGQIIHIDGGLTSN